MCPHFSHHLFEMLVSITSPPDEIIAPPSPTATSKFSVASSLASSDSVQQVNISLHNPPHWDSYLVDISSLFVESHLIDLEDHIEDICLLFDDSFDGVASPSSASEIVLHPPLL